MMLLQIERKKRNFIIEQVPGKEVQRDRRDSGMLGRSGESKSIQGITRVESDLSAGGEINVKIGCWMRDTGYRAC